MTACYCNRTATGNVYTCQGTNNIIVPTESPPIQSAPVDALTPSTSPDSLSPAGGSLTSPIVADQATHLLMAIQSFDIRLPQSVTDVNRAAAEYADMNPMNRFRAETCGMDTGIARNSPNYTSNHLCWSCRSIVSRVEKSR